MHWPSPGYIDGTSWSGVAAGIVFFIGTTTVVGGLVGSVTAYITETMIFVGAASLLVVGLSIGTSVFSSRPRGATASDLDSYIQSPSAPGASPLELYQSEGCPHCRKVRTFCSDHGISILLHNPRTAGTFLTSGSISNEERYDELVNHGQDQIPLLVDTVREEAVYESKDIIEYLRNHYV